MTQAIEKIAAVTAHCMVQWIANQP